MSEQIGGILTTIATNGSNATQQIGQVVAAIKSVFAVLGGTAGSATGGAATLPANPVGFIEVTLPDGTTGLVPYYNP